ncbi:MFS transporter [Acinetobacter sp. ANC 4470]|uniref:MFS transporter n=1 Tax=Acinetobacter sp. ANC 4470 TaxID=1977881 RepID=UPI000A32BF79|nr:MFS transporter [Acinetobacter sp. ANC 4470]OTG67785.1 MFS transporter [Acinetobacter sp. ANC 4470]
MENISTTITAQPSLQVEQKTNAATNKKSLIASAVGNLLEWFDWTIYAVASVYIAAALFDKSDPTSALLNTLAVFAVGFVSRPLGGFIFGPLANKFGRKNIMLTTMVLMALSSMMIAFIPSFSSIGYWASFLLLIARLIQGFAHGGETATSFAYIAEIAPNHRRGLWASSSYVANGTGTLLATLSFVALNIFFTSEEVYEWAWRIPFFAGGLLAFVALYLRRNMVESHVESDVSEDDVNWTMGQFLSRGFKLFLYEAGSTITFYTWVVCVSIYAITYKGMDPKSAFLMSCLAQIIYIICLPFQGLLSDYIGRKKTILITYFGCAVSIFPLWNMISEEPWTLFVAQTIGLILIGFLMSCKAAAMSEQIPTKYRTKMLGVFMSLAIAIFGGTASYINTWLYSNNQGWLFGIYLILICIISFIVVIRWKDNTGVPLDQIK